MNGTEKNFSYTIFTNSDRTFPRLLWYDYVFVSVMFIISTGFGIFFGCFGNKQSTAKDYLLGGKRMRVIPITLSLLISGIDSHVINFAFSAVCIFYTSLGGIKALIWIDTIQFTLTYGIVFFLLGKGIYDLGGFSSFWNTEPVQTRLDFLDWSLDITHRDTVWALFLGYIGHWMASSTIDPTTIQKLLSIPTYKDANWVIVLYGIGLSISKMTCVLMGLVMSATFANCDPLITEQIHKNDEMLPYFVMHVAKDIPGILGLYTAGLTTASLSTLSSILNGTSGTIYAIFLKKRMERKGYKKEGFILKILVVIIGILSTLMVYIIERLGEIVTLAVGLISIANGPLLGIFSLGLFFPTANSKGCFYGAITSFIVMCLTVAGNSYFKIMKKIVYPHKKISVDSCDFFVNTTITSNLIEKVTNPRSDEDVFPLFKISFYWFTIFGCFICIIMGLFFSWLTGNNNRPTSKKLLSPVIYPFLSKNRSANDSLYSTVDDARTKLSKLDEI